MYNIIRDKNDDTKQHGLFFSFYRETTSSFAPVHFSVGVGVNQPDEYFVLQRVVLPVDVHQARCPALPLAAALLLLLVDQVAVGGHAEVVVLQRRRVPEGGALDSHRASDRSEEAHLLAVEPRRLRLLPRGAAGGRTRK